MNSSPQTIKEIAIDDIEFGRRLRPVSSNGVASLLAAMEGQSEFANPIQLRKMRKGYRLIDGAHRVAAAKELGWQFIQAKVHQCTDDEARLLEIDCNIGGAELTVLDTMVFLAERKRVYVALHPETKAGSAGAAARWNATVKNTVASFAASAAEKFGVSQSKIFKLVAAGEALTPEDVAALRGIAAPLQKGEILAVAKIEDAAVRLAAIRAVAAGDHKNLSVAIAHVSRTDKPPVDPVEKSYLSMLEAWKRAPMAAKRRLVREIGEEVSALIESGAA